MKTQLILIFSFLLTSTSWSQSVAEKNKECEDYRANYQKAIDLKLEHEKQIEIKSLLDQCHEQLKKISSNSPAGSENSSGTTVSMTGTQPCAAQFEALKKQFAVTEGQQVTGQSAGVQQCLSITRNNFSKLYNKNGNSTGQFKWKKLIEGSDLCFGKIQTEIESKGTACTQGPQFPNVKEMFASICSEAREFKVIAARCDAAAYLLSVSDRDWGNKDHLKSDKLTGPITCRSEGIDTLDFEPCVKFVQQSGLLDAGVTVVKQTQDLYYRDQAVTAQMKASASNDSATGNLKALKEGVKGQEDLLNQRAAIDSAKAAMLYSLYADVPTREDITERCSRYRPSDEFFKGEQIINGCESAINHEPFFAFLENPQAKESMKAKMIKAGLEVTSDLVMAGIMNKRGNDISNAIAKVEAFKPIDPLAPQIDNAQSTFCQANPGNAKCLTGGLERTFDVMNDNVITFGEGGTGASYVTSNNPYVDPTATTIDSKNDTKKNSIGSVGNSIASAHQGSGLESIGPKASVSKGSAPSGGGGGGGGGGGVGGGGGGGALAGSQGQGGTMAAVQGKTPSYGGGGGSLSVLGSGGYGINKNKTASNKDDGNPFGKLFNKDGNKSGVVNFGRAPASVGNKGDNIFEMISKRYTNVNNDKRLIEYESK